jgi:predicted HTH domain antitoxin
MGETVTTRVDDEMARGIDFFAKKEKLDRSTITRRLLARALQEEELDYALEQYKNGDITIGRAAEIAKKSLREIMAIAAKRGIPFQYSLKSLREDAEALKKAK